MLEEYYFDDHLDNTSVVRRLENLHKENRVELCSQDNIPFLAMQLWKGCAALKETSLVPKGPAWLEFK